MQLEIIPISDLKPSLYNARTHSDTQIDQLCASIREFGFNNPLIIDETTTLIAGHGRLDAAISMGLTELPCVRVVGLTPTQKRAYIIADNKLALNSEWNYDLLASELDFIGSCSADIDFNITGFELDDLSPPATDLDTPAPKKEKPSKVCKNCGEII